MAEGNPRCEVCHGRGGVRGPYGWLRCECTRPTREQKRLQRRFNSIGAKNPDGRAVQQQLAQLSLEEFVNAEPPAALMDILESALRASGVKVHWRTENTIVVITKKGTWRVGVAQTR